VFELADQGTGARAPITVSSAALNPSHTVETTCERDDSRWIGQINARTRSARTRARADTANATRVVLKRQRQAAGLGAHPGER
jgi:hypothetical protein